MELYTERNQICAHQDMCLKPFTELTHIHQCLRQELLALSQQAEELLENLGKVSPSVWKDCLRALIARFDLFFVMFSSHSKAEDNIIIPAIYQKVCKSGNNIRETLSELENEHDGHNQTFEELQLHLLPLRRDAALNIDIRQQLDLRNLVRTVVDLVAELKSKIFLHFRKEEEELLPVLHTNFSETELNDVLGQVLGDRSALEVRHYMNILTTSLSEETRATAISELLEAAKGTRFESWLSHYSGYNDTAADITALQNLHNMISQGIIQLQPSFVPMSMKFGCKHYERKNKLFAPCCNKFFTCRLCHDEYYQSQGSLAEYHVLDRFQVKIMWCMLCGEVQRISNKCAKCHAIQANYFCDVCNLFENNKPVYHCPYCNVCRVGENLGVDFFHCMKCNACISTSCRKHSCREQSLEAECPICCQDLFTSVEVVKETQCGHFMHLQCYERYIRSDFRCPLCRKSLKNMTPQWLHYEGMILQYLERKASKAEQSTIVQRRIICHDCSQENTVERIEMSEEPYSNIPFKCPSCSSFNTSTIPTS